MKFQKIKVYLLLTILLSNMLIFNCDQIKRSKIRSKLSRNRSKGVLDMITNTLKGLVTNPENIFYFILGIITVFHSSAEDFYKQVKSVIDRFRPCLEASLKMFERVDELVNPEEKAELDKKANEVKQVDYMFPKEVDKEKYCENRKEQIEDYYKSAVKEMPEMKGADTGIFSYIASAGIWFHYKSESMRNKCEMFKILNAKKTEQEIIKNYHNIYQYISQCYFFLELDCDEFKPDTGSIWGFITMAYKYYSLYGSTKECIANIFKNHPDDKNLLKVDHSFAINAASTIVGAVANILTLGAWGGVKGGFYLIQLGVDLYNFYNKKTEDIPFNLGKLFGKGILAAKSLITGKKKKFRKFK
jgi:hypothetical protein